MTREEFIKKYDKQINYSDEAKRNPLAKYGISTDEGWMDIIEKCAEELVELSDRINFFQIKEKFGGLRFYTGIDSYDSDNDSDLWKALNKITGKYERDSFSICEHCGAPGQLASDRHWRVTLCDSCEAESRR